MHDISDVPVDCSKLANFLKYKTATICGFVTMVLVWLVFRLGVLPFYIYKSIFYESYLVMENVDRIYYECYRYFFIYLVGQIILLHVAWFFMFLNMGWLLVKKGETHDLSEHKAGEVQLEKNGHSNGVNGTTCNGHATNGVNGCNGHVTNGVNGSDGYFNGVNGSNGYSNKENDTNGHATNGVNGANGHSNGVNGSNGYSNGVNVTNGHATNGVNCTNGHSKNGVNGTNGHAMNGTNGHSMNGVNGANGHSNGVNGTNGHSTNGSLKKHT